MAAATGERSADQLARRRVAGGEQAGHGGGAVVVDDAQPTGAAHRALEDQRDREPLGERVDPDAVERLEEVRLHVAEHAPQLRLDLVELAEHRLVEQGAGDHRAAALRTGTLQHAAVLAIERREEVVRALRHRGHRRGQAVGVGELHPAELGADLGAEQVAVAGVDVRAERAAEERTPAGRDHDGAGDHAVRLAGLATQAARAGDAAVGIDEQLEHRAVIEDARPGGDDATPLALHVVRALQAAALGLAGVVDRERVATRRRAPAPGCTSRPGRGASSADPTATRSCPRGWPSPARGLRRAAARTTRPFRPQRSHRSCRSSPCRRGAPRRRPRGP